MTLGVLEQKDVVSVVNYAAGRSDVDANRIGILGISMGGASAILAAAKDKRIRAVVDDSGFSDAPRVIAACVRAFRPPSRLPICTHKCCHRGRASGN